MLLTFGADDLSQNASAVRGAADRARDQCCATEQRLLQDRFLGKAGFAKSSASLRLRTSRLGDLSGLGPGARHTLVLLQIDTNSYCSRLISNTIGPPHWLRETQLQGDVMRLVGGGSAAATLSAMAFAG